MKKLVVVSAFAAVAFAAYPATACDWNRQASAKDPVVATADQTPQATRACSGPNCAAPQPTSVASEASVRKTVDEAVGVVLVTDHH